MINEWWSGSADERFWMEITNRGDLGVNLWAPHLMTAVVSIGPIAW